MFVDSREQILASLSTVSNPYAGNPSHSYVCKIVIGGSEKNWTFWQDKSEIWHAVTVSRFPRSRTRTQTMDALTENVQQHLSSSCVRLRRICTRPTLVRRWFKTLPMIWYQACNRYFQNIA